MKFVCDDNLGRLARWLRTLGFDTVFERTMTDDRLLAVALAEERTIVTRDRKLAEKTLARRVILLDSTEPLAQMVEVVRQAELQPNPAAFFLRCPICNVPVDTVRKEDFADQIPPYVYRTRDSFHRCPSCARIFWYGTHIQRMREKLAAAGFRIE